ncbi:MAG: hypothetical protein U0457_09445 [Candidatus Sericytochromatia bacterium]
MFDINYLKASLIRAKKGNDFSIEPIIKYNLEQAEVSLYFFFKDNMSDDDFDIASTISGEVISDFDDDFELTEDFTTDKNKFDAYEGFIL